MTDLTTAALAVLAEKDPQTADELLTLHRLVELAGSQKAAADACKKAYDSSRKDIEALMRKHGLVGVPVLAGGVVAEIKTKVERVIDAKKFFGKVTRAVFWSLVSVPLGKAENEVGAKLVNVVSTTSERESLFIETVKGDKK